MPDYKADDIGKKIAAPRDVRKRDIVPSSVSEKKGLPAKGNKERKNPTPPHIQSAAQAATPGRARV